MLSDYDAGLAVGWMRGYQAAMDAVEAARQLTVEAQEMGLPDTPWESGKVGNGDSFPPTVWYSEAMPGELDDLYSGKKPS